MSDLPRWSEDGATPDELRLLDASRGERPDPAARARTLAALGLGGGGGPTGGPAPQSGNGPGAPGKIGKLARIGNIGTIGKLASLGVIAALVVAGGFLSMRPHRPAVPAPRPARAEVAPAAPTDAPVVVVAAPQERLADDRDRVVHRSLRRPPHEDDRQPLAPRPSLAEEVAALERARGALTGGDPVATLRVLDAYRIRFPEGRLSSEATVLRVQALLAQGNEGEAIFVADTFSAMHPGDPYTQRLKMLVSAAVKNSRGE